MRPNSLRDSGVLGSNVKKLYPRHISGGFLEIKAYAKLNLFLDVTGKRPDGYHNILSVMQTVDLFDELRLCKTKSASCFSFVSDSKEVPNDESNIVVRAARLLIREYKIKESFEIYLTKRIPVGAGLAGGSADCAAALRGIDGLLNLNIPEDELQGIGKSLGADVPFCLIGGTCLAKGIGDRLTPLAPHPDCAIVLAYPDIHVSTKDIFGKLCLGEQKSNNIKFEKILSSLCNNELTGVALSLYNVFMDLTSRDFPIITKLIGKLEACGAAGASMTGTGSAVFGYFEQESDAALAIDALVGDARTYLVKPVNKYCVRG